MLGLTIYNTLSNVSSSVFSGVEGGVLSNLKTGLMKVSLSDQIASALDTSKVTINTGDPMVSLVNWILQIAVPVGALAIIFLFSSAAFTMMTSAGNPDKLNEAKETVTNAIIGFVIIVMAVSILLVIRYALGLG